MLRLIPQRVRQVVLAESDCKNLFLCSLVTRSILEVIPIDALASFSASEASEKFNGVSTARAESANKQSDEVKSSTSKGDVGDGDWQLVYDVMRAGKKGIFFLREHMARLMNSLEKVSPSPLPSDTHDYLQLCLQEYATSPREGHNQNLTDGNADFQKDQNLKVVIWFKTKVHGGGGACPSEEAPGQMFVVYFVKSFFPPSEWYVKGTKFALLFNAYRENPRLKVMQPQLISRVKEAREASGAFEVMLVHNESDNYLVAEGSRSNYLLISESGKILCSDKEDILGGITLLATTRAAECVGLGAIEHRKLTLKDVCSTYALVMLGTSPGVLPVREILLYYDKETEANFHAAASFLGIALEEMRNFKTISSDPPRAVIEFAVKSDAIDRLMRAYEEEKYR